VGFNFNFFKNDGKTNNKKISDKKVVILTRNVIDGIISYSKMHHPYEAILILEGNRKKGEIYINNLVIPPFSIHGPFYSSFLINELPFDLKYVGTAHSHPSGTSRPSVEDLNHFYGLISIIICYPYNELDIHAYNSSGKEIEFIKR
jgi:proteasome lid subunit RPN8/RPN11